MRSLPWKLLRPYASRVVALMLVICLGAVAEAIGLVLLSGLLNVFLGAQGTAASVSLLEPVYRFARANPPTFMLLMVGVYLMKSFLAIVGTYWSFSLALRITVDWQKRLVRSFLYAPLDRLGSRQGGLVQIVLDEPGSAALGLAAAGLLAQNVLSTLTVYIVLLYVSVWVTLGLTILAGAAILMVAMISRSSMRYGQERYEAFRDGYAHMTELASAIKQFRAFGLEQKAEQELAAHLSKMRRVQLKLSIVGASPRLLIEVLFLCGLAVSVAILVSRMGDASVLSALGLSVMATVRLLPSFSTSASTWVQVQQALPAIMNIDRELRRLEDDSVAGVSPAGSVIFRDKIAVEAVDFGYSGRPPALVNVSLDIPRGQVTALAGPSGSGKSTVVDLLCGFYKPDTGRILVDGTDLREVDIRVWRQQLGVVLQDSFLVSGTIRENLCLLRPDCPEALLHGIVKQVGAETFINELPDGYDTRIGERGVRLSGGQRQRLAIARVLLREPSILILDEAMSALDVESEEALQQSIIGSLRGDMTLIVISHRLSALRRADSINMLEGGRLVESGCHETLLRRDGLYANLWRTSQIGTEDSRPPRADGVDAMPSLS